MHILWVLVSFVCGALPLSVYIGKLALGVDIRHYGDGNPGASNVFRAGGKGWGVMALLLDFLKGAAPVAVAHFIYQWQGWNLTAVALAPIVGHAYSPFLRGRGGKALAVTFGVWTGLSLYVIPICLGLLFAFWLFALKPEGWAVLSGCLTLLPVLLLMAVPPAWLGIWAGMTLILAWTHRQDLQGWPQIRPWRRYFPP